MMIGQIVAVNYKRGLVAFQIENGACGYFEVLDTVEFEKEDKIKGNLESLGGEKIIKIDTNEPVDVFIEDYGMTYNCVINKIFE